MARSIRQDLFEPLCMLHLVLCRMATTAVLDLNILKRGIATKLRVASLLCQRKRATDSTVEYGIWSLIFLTRRETGFG
jgi:hypothetical protein